ncbi:MAG: DUF190 domain-containing protein [Steroidobacteraceae bacterium]
MEVIGTHVRVRIYLGAGKRHGDRPLYEVIVLKARQLHLAGATVLPGSMGFGRSARLHTSEVMSSVDLPVIIEIIDSAEKIRDFLFLLTEFNDIGLITRDTVDVLLYEPHAFRP